MSADNRQTFWSWSLSRYAAEGVAQPLLQLQDEFQLDVNILLWCGWCAERYQEIPVAVIRSAVEFAGDWSQGVTRPLRAARRALRNPPAAAAGDDAARLRASIKESELAAERVEQEVLERLAAEALQPCTGGGKASARLRCNLEAYAAAARRSSDRQEFSALIDEYVVRLTKSAPLADQDEAAHA